MTYTTITKSKELKEVEEKLKDAMIKSIMKSHGQKLSEN